MNALTAGIRWKSATAIARIAANSIRLKNYRFKIILANSSSVLSIMTADLDTPLKTFCLNPESSLEISLAESVCAMLIRFDFF